MSNNLIIICIIVILFEIISSKKKIIHFHLQARIGIEPDVDEIRRYFSEHSVPPETIPEYLIYVSKLNCDHKSLKSVIRLACAHETSFKIEFVPVILPIPFVIQICLMEVHNFFHCHTGHLNRAVYGNSFGERRRNHETLDKHNQSKASASNTKPTISHHEYIG